MGGLPLEQLASGSKRCPRCQETKPFTAFHKDPQSKSGIHPYCAECCRAYARAHHQKHKDRHNAERRELRKKNPERVAQWDKKNARRKRGQIEQPTRPKPTHCECCGRLPTNCGAGKNVLVEDHCHETGKFRGWLCNRCNTGIGQLGDTHEGVLKALEYLATVGVRF